MIEIKVPAITANEDTIKLSTILKNKKDNLAKKNEIICILESSKTSFEFESPENGYIYFLFNEEDELKIGDTFILSSKSELDDKKINQFIKKKKLVKEQKISKKAKKLLEDNNINIKEIKKNGIINSNDIIEYMNKMNLNQKISDFNPNDYSKLEKIMKKNYPKNINFDDIENLKNLLSFAQKKYQEKWNRFIPPFDILFDRWKNAENYGFGDKSNISSLSYIIGDVKIGKNCYIGPYTILDGSAGLEIDDNTGIAAGVQIYSHDTISRSLSGYKFKPSYGKVTIGKNCFIGPNAVITKGVKIGNTCFLGANSVLTFNLNDKQAASGNPCEIIGKVEVGEKGVVIKMKK
jgi:acetyltransferase-like isoleucine patch superfamily enzyme